MKQADLFSAANVLHWGPEPTPGLPNWKRVSVCGVTYAIAGSDPVVVALGSSNLAHVTCSECLKISEQRA